MRPDDPTLIYNLALPLLMLAAILTKAGRSMARRMQAGSKALADRPHAAPWLDSPDISGKRLLAWTDQGVGEAIMFSSLIPDVVAAGRNLTIECEARLVPLFARSFTGVEVIPLENPPHSRFPCLSMPASACPILAHWIFVPISHRFLLTLDISRSMKRAAKC